MIQSYGVCQTRQIFRRSGFAVGCGHRGRGMVATAVHVAGYEQLGKTAMEQKPELI